MPAIAPPLAIPPEDLHTLGHWSRSGSVPAALAERARILLLAADGLAIAEIARQVGCSRPTVILWRHRYAKAGLDGLGDKHRPGRPQTVRADRRAEILAATLTPPPEHLGVTHWSSRLLAAELGVSHNTVARVWAEHDLKPWRTETFKFSTDPKLEAKVRDVVGLYLQPPERAVVLCLDEKAQILAFLKLVARAYPRRQLHLVLDNYGTHTLPTVRAWLDRHPRIHLHFTPTSASWMNLVEVFFSIITRQAIRRGSFPSVGDLVAAIRRFIDAWNQRCQPFVWVKDADDIMIKATRKRTSGTEH